MSNKGNTKLLTYILEKERKEKAAKRKRLFIYTGTVLVIALTGFGIFLNLKKDPLPVKPVYASADLSLQGVAKMLKEDPNGIIVKNSANGQIDTLRSIDEFRYIAGIISAPSTTRTQITNIPTENLELESVSSNAFDPEMDKVKREVQTTASRVNVNEPVVKADIMPSFPGGEAALYQFLSKQIRYPRQAVKNKTEGTVYVRFVIQPDGAITSPEVMRGIGFGCDEEALRVIRSMPAWNPGEIQGQKVPVFSSLAVNFKFL
ncbi:MAG: energy transducer TonB [Bacteroidota bacterium]